MFVAANVGVMDEVELIQPCIQQLRQIGVDVIFVGDMRSTDGTRDLLSDETANGDVFVVDLDNDEDILTFHQRVYEVAINKFSLDRILALDADEFWIPENGNLKDSLRREQADELRVSRYNLPLVDGSLCLSPPIRLQQYSEAFIISRPVAANRATMDAAPDLKHILTQIGPKVAIRPCAGTGFTMGGHALKSSNGYTATSSAPKHIAIAHAQFSSWQRFERKVNNIRRSLELFEQRVPAGTAWQWKRWRDIAEQGDLENEYLRQSLTKIEFEELRTDGTIVSLAEHFAPSSNDSVKQTGQSS